MGTICPLRPLVLDLRRIWGRRAPAIRTRGSAKQRGAHVRAAPRQVTVDTVGRVRTIASLARCVDLQRQAGGNRAARARVVYVLNVDPCAGRRRRMQEDASQRSSYRAREGR